MQFCKKEKLNPLLIGPFIILNEVGEVCLSCDFATSPIECAKPVSHLDNDPYLSDIIDYNCYTGGFDLYKATN